MKDSKGNLYCAVCGVAKPGVMQRGYGGRLYPASQAAHRYYVQACWRCFQKVRLLALRETP